MLPKRWGNQLYVRLSYVIHVATISISTELLGQAHRETISTRNIIAIIKGMLLSKANTCMMFSFINKNGYFIKGTDVNGYY